MEFDDGGSGKLSFVKSRAYRADQTKQSRQRRTVRLEQTKQSRKSRSVRAEQSEFHRCLTIEERRQGREKETGQTFEYNQGNFHLDHRRDEVEERRPGRRLEMIRETSILIPF